MAPQNASAVPDRVQEISDRVNGTIKPKGDGYQIDVNRLVARDGNTFIFVDYLFDTGDLFGATGTRMVPISEDEHKRRLEEYKDPEWSPLHHIYQEQVENGLDKSWSDWIDEQFRVEGEDRMLYDPSYRYDSEQTPDGMYYPEGEDTDTYMSMVETASDYELGFEAYSVECIGGGRMFGDNDYEQVYDSDLLETVMVVENEGFGIEVQE